jgi:hypothetical protein
MACSTSRCTILGQFPYSSLPKVHLNEILRSTFLAPRHQQYRPAHSCTQQRTAGEERCKIGSLRLVAWLSY